MSFLALPANPINEGFYQQLDLAFSLSPTLRLQLNSAELDLRLTRPIVMPEEDADDSPAHHDIMEEGVIRRLESAFKDWLRRAPRSHVVDDTHIRFTWNGGALYMHLNVLRCIPKKKLGLRTVSD